jgi:CO dehydrogenase maturation factor
MKLAVSGKGGVGKTTLAAYLALALERRGFATLAIDADPAPSLGPALGLSGEAMTAIVPISEDADLVSSRTATGYAGVFNLSVPVDDLIRERAVRTPSGVGLLVMGTVTSAGGGCVCPAAAVVRALLRRLIVNEQQAVVVDLEAGLEHLGRGTASGVDMLFVLVDGSTASCTVAGRIRELAGDLGIRHIRLVGSRLTDRETVEAAKACADRLGTRLFAEIPYDAGVARAGREGEPAPADSAIAAVVDDLLERSLREAGP